MLLVMLLATRISSSTFSCSLHVIFNFWIHLIIPYITLVSQLFSSTYWALAFSLFSFLCVFSVSDLDDPCSSFLAYLKRYSISCSRFITYTSAGHSQMCNKSLVRTPYHALSIKCPSTEKIFSISFAQQKIITVTDSPTCCVKQVRKPVTVTYIRSSVCCV